MFLPLTLVLLAYVHNRAEGRRDPFLFRMHARASLLMPKSNWRDLKKRQHTPSQGCMRSLYNRQNNHKSLHDASCTISQSFK